MAAAVGALEDGELDVASVDSSRFGVLCGAGMGGLDTLETACDILREKGPRRITPFLLPALIINCASSVLALELGAKGPNYAVVSACASGTHALGEAMRHIARGEADVMLAGGTEATVTPLGFAGFDSMRAMCGTSNDSPATASRPFDADRGGFVMGEGAGLLLIESEEHALARGAKIYCELAGYGATCDAHHIVAPHPEGEGMAQCLRLALADAAVQPKVRPRRAQPLPALKPLAQHCNARETYAQDVGYVNAHGTSTPLNDKFETMAFKRAFGEHARALKVAARDASNSIALHRPSL